MAGKRARSIEAAGIPEEHVANAVAYYKRHSLNLDFLYIGHKWKEGWYVQGVRSNPPEVGGIWYHAMPVDLEAACDAPHSTRRAWEEAARKNFDALRRGHARRLQEASW